MHEMTQMTTKVKKVELLEVLKKNRKTHRKIFEESLRGYKKEMIVLLARMLQCVKKGKRVNHMITLPIPTDMTESYDSVILMLEMGTEDVVELSMVDFQRFVQDKWEWRNNFLMSNSRYSNTAQVLSSQIMDE